jgi:hypothetical protein
MPSNRKWMWLVVILPWGLPLPAQTPMPGSAATSPSVVEGTVTRAVDGQPLKRARVILRRIVERPGPQQGPFGSEQRGSPFVATSDAAGKFSLRDVTAGRYRLTVERQGYVRGEYGQRRPGGPGTPLVLAAGQSARDLLFRLVEGAVITGRVTDEEGDPVIEGSVLAMRIGYSRNGRSFTPVAGAQTNDRGEYRVYGLAPGRYYVRASPGAGMGDFAGAADARSAGGGEIYAPSYYPGTTDPLNAVALQVGAGDQISGIDLSLAPQRAFRIRGRINLPRAVDASMFQRGGGIQVMLFRRGGSGPMGRAFTTQGDVNQESGAFEFRSVLPGSYTVQAGVVEGRRMLFQREPVEVGRADVENVTITIAPGLELTVRLRVEGPGVTSLNALRVSVTPRDEAPGFNLTQPFDSEGSVVLQGLSPDTYQVTVNGGPPGSYIKSMRLGTENVLEDGLTIPLKGSGPLEILLGTGGGRIEGQVTDSDNLPAGAVTIALVPEARRRTNPYYYRTAVGDAQGRFSLAGIPPGEYRLFAWDEVDTGAWLDGEFLAPFEDRALKVRLTEGALLTVDVKLLQPR